MAKSMSNDKCQYCGRPLAGEICPAHGYVGNPLPVTPTDAATSGVPTGAEMMWPVATPPAGWLIEDGSSQLIASYPDLSALIRSTYGGADATHFYLPDMRGLVPVGKAASGTFATLGGTGGEATHLLTAAEMPAHTHKRPDLDMYTPYQTTPTPAYTTTGAINSATTSAGGGGDHNNLQPYRVRQFVIKT